ncbi:hypothetical protein PM082_024443 [Marasmius tenuissimus]|nr:hypothetical protein PM082_024443 [Marasmius tenuissimus]
MPPTFRFALHQRSYTCSKCEQVCRNRSGLTRHYIAKHLRLTPPPSNDNSHLEDDEDDGRITYEKHPLLSGKPCDKNGVFLRPNTAPPASPPPPPPSEPDGWHGFENRLHFDFAYHYFVEAQSPAADINKALDMWAAAVWQLGGEVPWTNEKEMYADIDNIKHGVVDWTTVEIKYNGPMPPNPPKWMTETYILHLRDTRLLLHHQLADPGFKGKTSYSAYRQYNPCGKRVYSNVMSADWAWQQSDRVAEDSSTHGAMFVPVVCGSDKTTVSVATGHQEYHPVYQSPGNITNAARRGHGSGVLPSAFLPIPKTSKKHREKPIFKSFCRQLYHACLARIYEPLREGMTTPDIVLCADGHFRKVIYGVGPYIADYPEQVWLAGIVQGWCAKCDATPDNLDNTPHAHLRTRTTHEVLVTIFDPGTLWDDYGVRSDVTPFTHKFPRADIHELMAPDLLHQLVKGTFFDHLVKWTNEYLYKVHTKEEANSIIQDIDRRISAVPAFPGLRRFPDGRDFNQWTGDDSKALMKVYIVAIKGHVPSDMVKSLAAFMECCFTVRKNSLTSDDFDMFDHHLARFHEYREVYITSGVRADLSLPRQHSLVHYRRSIRMFGSPNGLCSSITESKHIKAVKEPWRRSNRYKALSQMIKTIARLEKMHALRQLFSSRGWLIGSTSWFTNAVLQDQALSQKLTASVNGDDSDDEDEDGEFGPVVGPKAESSIRLARTRATGYPRRLADLSIHLAHPKLPELIRRFLYDQIHPNPDVSVFDIPLEQCPLFNGKVDIFHSAVARFYAPSDICGAGGMYQECIRSNPAFTGDQNRRDTVLVVLDDDKPGMRGMVVARVQLFFSFEFRDVYYPCALVNWFMHAGDEPDEETGLWVVVPEEERGRRTLEVIHLDSIMRGVHLLPAFGSSFLPENFHYSDALEAFQAFYVNKYADHHSYEYLSPL